MTIFQKSQSQQRLENINKAIDETKGKIELIKHEISLIKAKQILRIQK